MDTSTEQSLQRFALHQHIRFVLTITCYMLIAGGLFVYVFYAFSHTSAIKLVTKFKKHADEYKTEKVMTNPRISFQHDDGQIYRIKASKAVHKNDKEAVLYEVFANGNFGQITSGQLNIDDEGNHLVFSQNPVLIINETERSKKNPR